MKRVSALMFVISIVRGSRSRPRRRHGWRSMGQMGGGAGMLTVADDGSLLVTEMSSMMGGGPAAG